MQVHKRMHMHMRAYLQSLHLDAALLRVVQLKHLRVDKQQASLATSSACCGTGGIKAGKLLLCDAAAPERTSCQLRGWLHAVGSPRPLA